MPNFADSVESEPLMLSAELAGEFGTVTLLRQASGGNADAEGGVIRNFVTLAEVKAQVQPVSSSVFRDYLSRALEVTHSVLFFADVGAAATDIIHFGPRVLRVEGYRDASAGLRVLWIADCLETIGTT